MRINSSHKYYVSSGDGKDDIASCIVVEAAANVFWLEDVWVHPEHRKQGIATEMIQKVLYDHINNTVMLRVQPFTDAPMATAQLQEWYHKLGFQHTKAPGVMLIGL